MTPKRNDPQHEREHGSLLAAQEKKLLVWIAERLPQRVNSDHLSLLGLSAMLAAGLAFWASSWNPWLLLGVVAALAVNWFGDSLDGTVARVRNQQRPRYGFYVDHVLDVAGAAFLFGGMAFSSHMSTVVGLGLLVAYMMVSAESYLATHARSVFKLSFMRIGPTELRLLLAAGALRVMVDPAAVLFGREFLLLDVGGVVATVGLGVAFVVSAMRNTAALYREEPLPRRDTVERHKPAERRRHRTVSVEVLPRVTRPNLGQPQLAVSPLNAHRKRRRRLGDSHPPWARSQW
jgi:phosphatidylglycerophosphate synthase